jgi:hypothetical protein
MALTMHGLVNPHSSNESFTLDYAFEGQHPRILTVDPIAFAALHESESGPHAKSGDVRFPAAIGRIAESGAPWFMGTRP